MPLLKDTQEKISKKLLIKNIKKLVQVEEQARDRVSAADMSKLPCLENAWLAVEDGIIVDFGKMENFPGITDWSGLEVMDVEGRMVFPTWCDPHTHIVYADNRENEFVDRINGLSYEEIAARGGGILNSAQKLQNATEEELFESAMQRIDECIKNGTGAIEIKSGYGLSVEAEIKMLRVIKEIKNKVPIPVKSTFLAAHAFPEKYKNNHEGYIDEIINKMLPIVEKENLADYIDVFCEKNYFDIQETDRIIKAGKTIGLKPKIHVNQFNSIGGIRVAIENNALSVDHLETLTEEDIRNLKENPETVPTLLPGCSFFINIPYSPAKKLLENGISFAFGTDYNPGSTPSGNIPFLLSLACIKMNLNPEQAINAVTINAASAMELQAEMGSICRGKRANFFITKQIPSYAFIPYSFGSDTIETIVLNGEVYKG